MLTPSLVAGAVALLTGLYGLDRVVKAALVARFFREDAKGLLPDACFSVALIQPVTRGATALAANLAARVALDYPGVVHQIVVCDAADHESQNVCRAAFEEITLVQIEPDIARASVATKVAKMAAGVARVGNADVICFVDDDIRLPTNALRHLVAPLYQKTPAGATFGLACQTSWSTVWESLMSGFVNANALTGYVPLTFFIPPYTITGHVFALRRKVFMQAGGMTGLEQRFDDDHEIARRVRALGLPIVQTGMVYGVSNALDSCAAYRIQMRRWFVMPRQAMAPYLSSKEQAVSLLLGIGNLLPPLVLLGTAFAPNNGTVFCSLITFVLFILCYAGLEARYLPFRTPWQGILLLPVIAFLTPVHVLVALLLPGDRITWRGQSFRARHGGVLEMDDQAKEE